MAANLQPLPRRDALARAAAAPALYGIAVAHLLDLPHKVEEAPYMAVLFCLLMTGCTLCGLALVRADERTGRRLWAAAAALSVGAIAGYCLSRAVPLPQIQDHVGDWVSGPGIASLVLESLVVVLAVVATGQRVAVALPAPRMADLGPIVVIALVLVLATAGLAHAHGVGPGGAKVPHAAGSSGHHLCFGCPPAPPPAPPAWVTELAFALTALGSYRAVATLRRRAV